MTDNPASLSVILALGGCIILWLVARDALPLPHVSKERIVVVLLWAGLIGLLWVSDYPAAWRVPEMVEYLAETTLSVFRILLVTATGTVLFGSMVAMLFFTRPKSRRRTKLDQPKLD